MNINLDPDVVLFHLKHILGESISISEEQLTDFICDLRKLIRRDKKRYLSNKENSYVGPEFSIVPCKCHEHCHSIDEQSSVISESTAQSTVTYVDQRQKKIDNRQKQPTTSFIKPWRLNPPPKGSLAQLKSDPVQLYQQYQEQWKQIRVPGESAHERLRWTIRERMLGQDPQPRVSEEHPSPCESHEAPCFQEPNRTDSNLHNGESQDELLEESCCPCSCDCCYGNEFRCRNCPFLDEPSERLQFDSLKNSGDISRNEIRYRIDNEYFLSNTMPLVKDSSENGKCKKKVTFPCSCSFLASSGEVDNPSNRCQCSCIEPLNQPVTIRLSKKNDHSMKMNVVVRKYKCYE